MHIIPHRLAFIFTLLLSVLLFTGCGGGGGGGGGGGTTGTSDDTDGDGFANSVDVDDDNNGLIEISSLEQLDWMRNDMAGTSLTDNNGNVDSSGCPVGGCYGYELVADLDFDTNGDGVMDANDTYDNNGSGWLPIGDGVYASSFTADFNGNGYTIHHLYINRPTETYNGLFGVVSGEYSINVIQNVNLKNVQVTGAFYTGGLVGYVRASTISNSSASGVVEGYRVTGGLVGQVEESSAIRNSTASVTVRGSSDTTGGLVGYMSTNSTISNSSASGAVTSSGKNTGGLVGVQTKNTTIRNSTASGAVTGKDNYTGGLVGIVYGSTFSNCSASGAVTGSGDYTGGLAGYIDNSTISNSSASGAVTGSSGAVTGSGNYTGGLAGYVERTDVNNSAASGAVTGDNNYTGGLVGYISTSIISNSSASGAVTGNNKTGGLAGQVNSSTSSYITFINNSFSTGSVTATTGIFVGGLIGHTFRLTLENSFATGKVDGVRYVGGLIGDANTGTTINHNFATGKVTGSSELGALVGWSDSATYTANYFANDKGIANAIGNNYSTPGDINPAGTTGAALAELQCPTTANDTTCAASLLYENWDTALWDFGSNAQLPGLSINGTVYRDGDGNGVLD